MQQWKEIAGQDIMAGISGGLFIVTSSRGLSKVPGEGRYLGLSKKSIGLTIKKSTSGIEHGETKP